MLKLSGHGEFCNTIMRRRKIRENSSKKRISLHDTRMRGKVPKCTEMHTKKRSLMTRYRRKGKSLDFWAKLNLWTRYARRRKVTKSYTKKNVHQDILDTLKSRLLKNTNIRGLY